MYYILASYNVWRGHFWNCYELLNLTWKWGGRVGEILRGAPLTKTDEFLEKVQGGGEGVISNPKNCIAKVPFFEDCCTQKRQLGKPLHKKSAVQMEFCQIAFAPPPSSKRTLCGNFFRRKSVNFLKQRFWLWKWIFWRILWSNFVLRDAKACGYCGYIRANFFL